jgi:hypothetical protein
MGDTKPVEWTGLALIALATLLNLMRVALDLGLGARIVVTILLILGGAAIAFVLKSEGREARAVPLGALILVAVQLSLLVGHGLRRRWWRRLVEAPHALAGPQLATGVTIERTGA